MLRSAPIQQCPANRLPQGGRGLPRRCAFTLVELLVVMGVIAVLATVTLVSVRAITDNARLSSATNTVMAALDNARALAMKKNKLVLVAFRPRLEGTNQQLVEIVTAQWSGDSSFVGGGLYDRFVPIPDVPIRQLPVGVKVAGPYYRDPDPPFGDDMAYGQPTDELWVTQSHLPAMGGFEAGGELIGVMYMPDGTTQTRNPQNDSSAPWVDFDNSGDEDVDFNDPNFPDGGDFWEFDHPDDETDINLVPFLAAYDDEEAREMFGDDDWNSLETRVLELTKYITQFADRIHFNRYTGVAMK
ncbi:MAG: prepilin-type N-terminal cleavage/methylation domain-containing protein [Planctomycetota bacterium]|nr:prepilin-type N-terminal cleavage/methylation domain-containing protein [Planctomycetota bacterium]